jgi:hypothetical protein
MVHSCYSDSAFHLSTECSHFYCSECIVGTLEAIIETGQFPAWCPQCRVDGTSSGDNAVGRITPEACAFLQQQGVISDSFLHRFLRQNEQHTAIIAEGDRAGGGDDDDDDDDDDEDVTCPKCSQCSLKPRHLERLCTNADGPVMKLWLCVCGTPMCGRCRGIEYFPESHQCVSRPQYRASYRYTT